MSICHTRSVLFSGLRDTESLFSMLNEDVMNIIIECCYIHWINTQLRYIFRTDHQWCRAGSGKSSIMRLFKSTYQIQSTAPRLTLQTEPTFGLKYKPYYDSNRLRDHHISALNTSVMKKEASRGQRLATKRRFK